MMKYEGHSAAPWTQSGSTRKIVIASEPLQTPVATIKLPEYTEIERQIADARLIADAPTLAALCDDLAAALGWYVYNGGWPDSLGREYQRDLAARELLSRVSVLQCG